MRGSLASRNALLALVLSLAGCQGSVSRNEPPPGGNAAPENTSRAHPSATVGAPPPNGAGNSEPADDRKSEQGLEYDGKDAELIEASKVFARELASVLGAGKLQNAQRLAVTEDELRSLMTTGGYSIVSMVLGQNQKNLQRYVEALEGTVAAFEWHPGTLGRTPANPGIWRRRVPSMSDSVLTINPATNPLPVRVDQLLWVDGEWKILRLRR